MAKKPRTSRPYSQARDPRQRYRVHDGSKDKITLVIDGAAAENLTWDDAQKVKSYAASRLKERTATVEESVLAPLPDGCYIGDDGRTYMGAPPNNVTFGNLGSVTTPESPPNPDPVLEEQRQAALRAAGAAAAAANARHPVAAAKQAIANVVKPADISLDSLDDEQLTGSIDDLLGGDDEADLEAAGVQAAADRAAYEAAGKALYESMKDAQDPPWEQLADKDRADYSWSAANPPAGSVLAPLMEGA